jgi:hypothetical protein
MLILTVIYLGNNLPRYVLKNLQYLQTTFCEDEVYFLSDSEDAIVKASKTGVKTWLAPSPDEHWKEARENLTHSMGFRDGFWFKTLARIFVLDAFMQLHPASTCLQIEADVFLFPNFPISKFRNLDAEIAFPMESRKMGIASILFLKDNRASEKLVRIALREIELNSKVTDMSLLGKVAHSNTLRFIPLPTLPLHMQFALNQPDAVSLTCIDSCDFSGVFDGISVGQYLLGIDPRNSRGALILHRNQPSHAINPEKLELGLDANENLVLNSTVGPTSVYNLHNHAKDLRLYNTSSRKRLLKKRLASSMHGERKEFVVDVFLLSAFNALGRRVRRGSRKTKI